MPDTTLTSYQLHQLEKYGNILPDDGTLPEEFENGELVMQEQQVWFEHEEEMWLEEQAKSL